MKSVLISIRPKWCELIARGEKTIEIRKTAPNIDTPFKCYIYCTKNSDIFTENAKLVLKKSECNGKVVGEFVCDGIIIDERGENLDVFERCGKMSRTELIAYGATDVVCSRFKKDKRLYGWHISNLKIYDKPKEINEFIRPCMYGEESEHSCFQCEKSGFAPDMNLSCYNIVKRAPQSWCYVEGVT